MPMSELSKDDEGPSIVDGLCVREKHYCMSCNGSTASNCRKGPEHSRPEYRQF